MKRPDFDVGDLVVCVDDGPCLDTGMSTPLKKRAVYSAKEVILLPPKRPWPGGWYVVVSEAPEFDFGVRRFRKLDKLPPEFFAGEIEAPVKVTA